MEKLEAKRRYTVTLTPSNVERFQSLCRDFKMPLGTMSAACDDAIRQMADTFQLVKNRGGKLTMTDLFKMIGEQMELITKEERKEDENNKKEKVRVSKKNV